MAEPTEADAQQPPAQASPRSPEPKEIRREDVLAISRQLARWPDRAPSPEALADTIRRLSKARRIAYLDHGDDRFEERFAGHGFDVFDMHDVLETGTLDGGAIEAGKKEGEWKVKMVGVPDGTSRKMGVVTIVVQEKRLLIKTVEWEDR